MAKEIIKYFLTAAFFLGMFIGGFYSGIHVFLSMKSTSYLQDSFMLYAEVEGPLQSLDQGNAAEARASLKIKSDIAVMQIDGFSEHADEKTLVTACKILRSIAKHRDSHANLYPKQTEEDEFISKILAKWKGREC